MTCLCLTMAGRSEFLKRAVECFPNQTYPNREMLIVADSLNDRPRVWANGSARLKFSFVIPVEK